VASERITDPDFSKTVVLLVHFDDQGAIGLILNRPLKERPDGLYSGGPLALQTYAVLRSRTPPPDSIRLLENVYVTVNRKFVEEMASARARPASVRIYHGSIGWTERQLRNEVAAHFWRVFPGDAGTVFDAHVDSMWTRLRKQ
jgi:putative transcriptional regulator